jgi:hypothetical protein
VARKDSLNQPFSWRNGIGGSLVAIPLVWLIQIYGIAHLLMGIPLSNLLEPYLVILVPSVLLGPSLCWAHRMVGSLRTKQVRSMAIAGTYMWLWCVVALHYLGRLNVMAPEDVVPMYIVCGFGCGLGFLLATKIRPGKPNPVA